MGIEGRSNIVAAGTGNGEETKGAKDITEPEEFAPNPCRLTGVAFLAAMR